MTKTISISPVFDAYLWYIKNEKKSVGASQLIQQGIILASQLLLSKETAQFSEWCKENGHEDFLKEFIEHTQEIFNLMNSAAENDSDT